MLRLLAAAALVASATVFAPTARADSITMGFELVTNNAPAYNFASQLYVTISDYSSTQVLFVMHNGGGSAYTGSICDIYWGPQAGGDPTSVAGLLGTTVTIDSANTSAGVSFSNGASPGNAPGGTWVAGAAADSDSPVKWNGIQLGEKGGFRLDLFDGATWDDVKAGILAGDLRMALHIQGITGGKSDTYESVAPAPVPEPGTLALVSGALGLGALVRRRRQARRARDSQAPTSG